MRYPIRVALQICLLCITVAGEGTLSHAQDNALNASGPATEGLNLTLLLDSSGSMTGSDPEELRLDAAKMVVDRLPPSASASVVDFDGSAQTLASSANASAQRARLKQAIEQIDANGGTDIGDALREGARSLRANTQQRNAALLLTDGKGEYDGEIKPYKANGWCLYTVALGPDPNLQLLRSLADSTCGQYMKATDAMDLSRGFGQVIGDVQRASLITTAEGRVGAEARDRFEIPVDNTLRDLRLLVAWPGGALKIRVFGPQGRPIEVDLMRGRTYAVGRIQDVSQGQYTVVISTRGTSPSKIPYWFQASGVSPLRLEANRFPTAVLPDFLPTIQLSLSLTQVRRQSVGVEAICIRQDDGARRTFTLDRRRRGDHLELVGQIPQTGAVGDHRVRVQVTGKTRNGDSFSRTVDRTYTVTPDADMSRPVIVRAFGTQVVLRGARAFGLRSGLTIYVHAPDGRRVGTGIITTMHGNRATVELEGVMSANDISTQHTVSFDPVQWRADR